MTNIYWPVYKNLERELLNLTYSIHIDNTQLQVYSSKISDLIIRSAIEIESISKELYLVEGGEEKKYIKYDEIAIKLLNEKWLLAKKVVIISSPNCFQTNKIIVPFIKKEPRENGKLTFKWNLCYQKLKPNRRENLSNGNLENLFSILSALFLLNIYFKKEFFDLGKDSKGNNLPHNLGSELFAIKVHPNGGLDQYYRPGKNDDFDECTYFVRLEDYHEKRLEEFLRSAKKKFSDIVSSKKGFNKLGVNADKPDFLVDNIIVKFLGSEDYMKIINVAYRGLNEVSTNFRYIGSININEY